MHDFGGSDSSAVESMRLSVAPPSDEQKNAAVIDTIEEDEHETDEPTCVVQQQHSAAADGGIIVPDGWDEIDDADASSLSVPPCLHSGSSLSLAGVGDDRTSTSSSPFVPGTPVDSSPSPFLSAASPPSPTTSTPTPLRDALCSPVGSSAVAGEMRERCDVVSSSFDAVYAATSTSRGCQQQSRVCVVIPAVSLSSPSARSLVSATVCTDEEKRAEMAAAMSTSVSGDRPSSLHSLRAGGHAGVVCLEWHKRPPSAAHLLRSLSHYGLPLIAYQQPFFSDANHLPPKRSTTFGGQSFFFSGHPDDPRFLAPHTSVFGHAVVPAVRRAAAVPARTSAASTDRSFRHFSHLLTTAKTPPDPDSLGHSLSSTKGRRSSASLPESRLPVTSGAFDSCGREVYHTHRHQQGVGAPTSTPTPTPTHTTTHDAPALGIARGGVALRVPADEGDINVMELSSSSLAAAGPSQGQGSERADFSGGADDVGSVDAGLCSHRDEVAPLCAARQWEPVASATPEGADQLAALQTTDIGVSCVPAADAESCAGGDRAAEKFRPPSPKYDENFLTTLSYFLSPKRRSSSPVHSPRSTKDDDAATTPSPARAVVHTPRTGPGAKRKLILLSQPHGTEPSPSPSGSAVVCSPRPRDGCSTTRDSGAGGSAAAPMQLGSPASAPPLADRHSGGGHEEEELEEEDHARQHLTILSVEVHANSRGQLRPNPAHDSIQAIVYTLRTDSVRTRRTAASAPAFCDEFGIMMWVEGTVRGLQTCPHPRFRLGFRARVQSGHSGGGSGGDGGGECPSHCAHDMEDMFMKPAEAQRSDTDGVEIAPVVFGSEAEMLEAFIRLVRVRDPDLIVGYEMQRHSLGYIVERAEAMWSQSPNVRDRQRDMARELSRTHLPAAAASSGNPKLSAAAASAQAFPWQRASRPCASAAVGGSGALLPQSASAYSVLTARTAAQKYRRRKSSGIVVAGRILLNMWRIMRSELKLNTYTFENVVFHTLGVRVPHFSYQTLTSWWQQAFDTVSVVELAAAENGGLAWNVLSRVLEHHLTRAFGSLCVLDRLDLISRTSELARVFGIEFFAVLTRGSQYRVESMMVRLAKQLNYVVLSPSRAQVTLKRAVFVVCFISTYDMMDRYGALSLI